MGAYKAERNLRKKVSLPYPALAALALLVALCAPLAALVVAVSPADVLAALALPEVRDAAGVSLEASLLALTLALVLGVPAAHAIARSRPMVRQIAVVLVALPLVFPPIASGVMLLAIVGDRQPIGAWLAEHGLRVVDRLGGVTLTEFFACAPFVVVAAVAAFAGVDRRYEEAARTLGASEHRILMRIAIPLALPGIASGALLGWLRALGEYGATSVVAYHPTSLPIALSTALSTDGLQRALAIAYLFATIAVVVLVAGALVRRRLANRPENDGSP